MIKRLLKKVFKPDHCDSCGAEIGFFYGKERNWVTTINGVVTRIRCHDCYCEHNDITERKKH